MINIWPHLKFLKFLKNYDKRSQITSPKIRHQNDVTIFFPFLSLLPLQNPGCAPERHCNALHFGNKRTDRFQILLHIRANVLN